MKRYSFSLMELMIALSLITLLIGFLFSSLYQNVFLEQRLKKGEEEVLTHARVQQRLSQIFARIDQKKGVYLDEKNVLHVAFDHGIDPDEQFSGKIPATIGIENGHLALTLEGKESQRKDLLCLGKTMECSFLYHDGERVLTTPTWDQQEKSNPLYIRLRIDQEPYILWVNHKGKEIPLLP